MLSIKSLIKRNRVLTRIAYTSRQVIYSLLLWRFRNSPVDRKRILLYRSRGGYGDNPRAIAEFLHLHNPDYKLVWVYDDDRYYSTLPEYVIPIKFETREFFYELATCGAWVCSSTLPLGTTKKESQIYIQTWHGDKFIKKIANDAAIDVADYGARTQGREFCENRICDYWVTGCEWFVPIAKSAFGYEGKFLRCGMPRNDSLANIDSSKVCSLRAKLGIMDGCKILMYAPTFRDYEKSHDVIGSNIDINELLDELEARDGCSWVCLTRAHDGSRLTLKNDILEDNSRILDVTTYPDMADLLPLADMLISDYSSCAADFALTGRPVLMYQDDIDMFEKHGRTLYFSREESPYITVTSMEEAKRVIRFMDSNRAKENCDAILSFYRSYESGEASRHVVEVITRLRD